MILEEGIVGLDNWPSRFKCPPGFTLQPWQHGDAVSFTPTPGESRDRSSGSRAANDYNIFCIIVKNVRVCNRHI